MNYKFDDFQACLNQVFVLEEKDYRDALRLVKVDRLSESNAIDGRDVFSIIFQSQLSDIIPQNTYHMTNEQMGELKLFIVPVAQDASGVRYEAIFS